MPLGSLSIITFQLQSTFKTMIITIKTLLATTVQLVCTLHVMQKKLWATLQVQKRETKL